MRRQRPAVSTAALRLVAAAQLGLGGLLLSRPEWVARAVSGPPAAAALPSVIRLLGVRLVGQGGATLVKPIPVVARVGAVADVLHGVSMAAVTWGSRRYRRAAAVSAAVAASTAAATAVTVRPR